MFVNEVKAWCDAARDQPLMLGYGSLMSRDSRTRFSNIEHDGMMVTVKGYRRGWITRSLQEQQTYVGALPDPDGVLNAQIVPVRLDPALANREKDYQFERVSSCQIHTALNQQEDSFLHEWLAQKEVYICRSLQAYPADQDFPVHLSYVDTCMAGCLEAGGEGAAIDFVKQTGNWSAHLIDDRDKPKYPRAAKTDHTVRKTMDRILREHL